MILPLTSLRFFFALAVFLSHINIANFYPKLMQWFWEGFIGVGFFFMLSGFILSYNYKEKLLQGFSFKSFYLARFARVYPTHFLLMCIALFLTDDMEKLLHHIFLIQSWSSDKSTFFSLNSPSWSISAEAFFYFCFPFLILLRRKAILIFLSILIAILYVNISSSVENKHYWLYINPAIRLAEFLLGIFLYDIFSNLKKWKLGTGSELFALFVLATFLYFHKEVPISYRYSIYYWIPMFVLLGVFATSTGFLSKILSNKTLVYLGEASFSFYLIHYLVIQNIKTGHAINDAFLTFAISLLLSCLCFSFYEKPLNKKIRAMGRR